MRLVHLALLGSRGGSGHSGGGNNLGRGAGAAAGNFDANSIIAGVRSFYMRCLSLIIVFAALATIVGVHLPGQESKDWTVMQYVWWVENQLPAVFWAMSLFVMGYVVVLTILYIGVGKNRD